MTTISDEQGQQGQGQQQGQGGGAADLLNADQGQQGGQQQGQQGGGDQAPWWDPLGVSAEKLGDRPSDADWLKTKGFGGFSDLIRSARELESKVGSKLIVPNGPDDKEGWEQLAKALGRPDTPDGYDVKLKLETEDSDAFLAGFRQVAHELGLPPHAAQRLADWFEGSVEDAGRVNSETARAELKAEWKGDYDANLEHARRAMGRLEMTPDDVNRMAAGYGLARTMQLLAKVGNGLAEDGGLAGQGSGAQTLDAMKARKSEILANPELAKKLSDGSDPGLKAEWERIIAAEAKALEKAYGRAA